MFLVFCSYYIVYFLCIAAIIIFVSCAVVMVLVSLFTTPVPLDALGALTWPTLNKPRYRGGGATAEYVVNPEGGIEMTNAYGSPGEGSNFNIINILYFDEYKLFEELL